MRVGGDGAVFSRNRTFAAPKKQSNLLRRHQAGAPFYSVDEDERPVAQACRAGHLGAEIDVARAVDKVDEKFRRAIGGRGLRRRRARDGCGGTLLAVRGAWLRRVEEGDGGGLHRDAAVLR